MPFGDGYEFGMTTDHIRRKWPNLKQDENFIFTSEQTWDYNCVCWSLNNSDNWKQFSYTIEGDIFYDESIEIYINYFRENGYEECADGSLEISVDKICIFTDRQKIFTHVCRQLEDGRWASKMGNFEDIEHNTLEDLVGTFYGSPSVYMKRNKQF